MSSRARRHVLPLASRLLVALLAVVGLQVVPVAAPASAAGPVVVNGGFEDLTGLPADGVVYLGQGTSLALPGWTVSGSVEIDRSQAAGGPWNPAEGSASLDLNGTGVAPGAVRQTVETVPGTTYTLAFAGVSHPQCGPDGASVLVRWQGATVATESFPLTRDPVTPGWQERTVELVATGTTAVLELASGVLTGSCGPVVDAVRLSTGEPSLSGVSLTAQATTPPGAATVPVGDVPLDEVPPEVLDLVASAPLRSVPLRSVPLRSVPLRSVPLRSVPLRSVPLRSVTLAQLPLLGGLTWSDVLAGTALADRPVQEVTLDEVITVDPPRFAEITLATVDLSASPLRGISVASVYLGDTPVERLPLDPAHTTVEQVLAGWCEAVAASGAGTCTELGITGSSPVLALDLAGVPLRSVPLRSVPLRSVPVTAPLRSVPLRSVPLRSVPLRSIPLRAVDGLDVAAAPALRDVQLGRLSPASEVRRQLVGTGDEQYLGTTTLGQVRPEVLGRFTLADLGPFDTGALADLTVGQVADHVAASVTVGDALVSLLDPDSVPWESLPLDALDLPRNDLDGALVRYTASFDLGGGGPARAARVAVRLPAGWSFAGGVDGADGAPAQVTEDGRVVAWDLGALVPGTMSVDLAFDAHPPLVLGGGSASLEVSLPALGTLPALTGGASASVTVVDATATDPATAPVVAPGTLVVGHASDAARPGYVRVAVPPAGTRVSMFLGQLSTDNDLVVYGPAVPATTPGAAPLRSVPLRSVPLPDPGVDAVTTTGGPDALRAPAPLQDDVPRLDGLPLAGASAQRGTLSEQVDLLSTGAPGYWTVQVSGYNGASSAQPWVLRTRELTPPATSCPPRGYPAQTPAGVGSPAGLPDRLPPGTAALFLVNRQQLLAEYPAADVQAMLDQLAAVAARADVRGAVLQVDGSAAVAQAYTAWNADPCSVPKANVVADAVSGLVVGYAAQSTALRSVTLVGSDSQLPHGRVPDLTVAVNERGFAPEATGVTAAGARFDNPFSAAAAAGYLLSDDPYGTTEAVPWLDRELYVPTLAVGRLVETPAQVQGQVAQFVRAGGVVDPSSALTTGYDFLSDGARAVDAGLAAAQPQARRASIIDDVWTRGTVLDALLAPTPPSIVSLNAHFDPRRALPAAEDAAGTERDLLVTGDVVGAPGFGSRLLFSMGCHAGLNVPAGYGGVLGADAAADWPKAFASEGALWVANTGYGLGDTATVALSEQLMAAFAQRLDGRLTAGEALVYAKQSYLGSLGVYGSADEKVLQQIVFYGLPMWRVGGPTSDGTAAVTLPPVPAPATVSPAEVAPGLLAVDQVVASSFTRQDSPDGSFWTVGGEAQTTSGLPVQPRTSRAATPADPSLTGRGVLVTSLRSQDVAGVDPRFARAVLDRSATEPEQELEGVSFPAGLAQLTTARAPGGPETRLVVVPGQFSSPEGATVGTQRLFGQVGTRSFYSRAPGYEPPTFTALSSQRSGSTVTFRVAVDPAAGEQVARVLVLARDGARADWLPVELERGEGGVWERTVTVRSGTVEWFAQAVSSAGNVGTSSNKGALFASEGTFVVDVDGPVGDDGTYTGPVEVSVVGPAETYTASVDGGAPQVLSDAAPLRITADGPHVVVVRGLDGTTVVESATVSFRIDATAPVVTVVPSDGSPAFRLGSAQTGTLSCVDPGSGLVEPCPSTPVTVDTSQPGLRSVALSALGLTPVSDEAGNVTTSAAYQVRYGVGGFEAPLSADGVSRAKAGSAVPVKFALLSATGTVTDLAAVTGVSVRRVACSPGASDPGLVDPVPASVSSLKVVDGRFVYVWKTDRAWAGSCRQLTFSLADGTTLSTTLDLR